MRVRAGGSAGVHAARTGRAMSPWCAGAMFRLPLRTVATSVAGAVRRGAGAASRRRPHRAGHGRAAYQRSVARKARPCSGASSLAGSLRVPSTPNATAGPSVQRTPVRHARAPVSESASPA